MTTGSERAVYYYGAVRITEFCKVEKMVRCRPFQGGSPFFAPLQGRGPRRIMARIALRDMLELITFRALYPAKLEQTKSAALWGRASVLLV